MWPDDPDERAVWINASDDRVEPFAEAMLHGHGGNSLAISRSTVRARFASPATCRGYRGECRI